MMGPPGLPGMMQPLQMQASNAFAEMHAVVERVRERDGTPESFKRVADAFLACANGAFPNPEDTLGHDGHGGDAPEFPLVEL